MSVLQQSSKDEPLAAQLMSSSAAMRKNQPFAKRARVASLAAKVGVPLAHSRTMALDTDIAALDRPRALSQAIADLIGVLPVFEFAPVGPTRRSGPPGGTVCH